MLQQYFQAKDAHPGVIMAMRVGDFYEFYGEDAETAAAVLGITLTGREDGENGRIAMAGVPYHSVEKYLAKIVQSGMKVALCDQVEDPKTAKGLVRRAVTRVMTPGTVMEDSMLSGASNNFLTAIYTRESRAGIATLDSSTGEFLITEVYGEKVIELILQELARIRPSELLVEEDDEHLADFAVQTMQIALTKVESLHPDRAARVVLEQFKASQLAGFGLADRELGVVAGAMALQYASKNGLDLSHIDSASFYEIDQFMSLDPATRRSLELTANLADGSKRFTLLGVLDQTVTGMGARLLRRWIEQPLLDAEMIRARQDAVELLVKMNLDRADLRDAMRRMSDIERLVSRCATGLAGPRDLAGLRATLLSLPSLHQSLAKVAQGILAGRLEILLAHSELCHLLESSVIVDPPMVVREGGIIQEGFDPELDQLRSMARDGRKFIAELEQAERDRTGISTLKVGYNNVFGYYIEISKLKGDTVPDHYIRKQTTANAERYITAELKEFESTVLGANDKAIALEAEIFSRLRHAVNAQSKNLLETARAIAEIDTVCSLAETASQKGYRRPEILDANVLEVTEGRHPVVEASTPGFVPNDLVLGEERMMILTGPNMSGKSTYLRQNAIMVLMAQIGSFVPARKAKLGICDRIFARIGAKDEIALGQSTFMVEMVESAYILNHATDRSLVILDEVGRGTSTYDGLAIAWAMVEHLQKIAAKTLFATHYHQLNSLAQDLTGVASYRVSVKEVGDDIVWTHRVLPGGTDKSYGIHVARKAGVPKAVLNRAQDVLAMLETTQKPGFTPPTSAPTMQLTLFGAEDPWMKKELEELDINSLTPLEAIALLGQWKRQAAEKG
jgi:DNA mismatch repair protein MutS